MSHIQGDQLSIFVLGVGGGADHVYRGLCSSSFIVLKNGKPFCLVDLGLGVTKTLADYGYELPPNVVITHNHTDHSGELPVVLRVEHAQGRLLNVIAEEHVLARLQTSRMAEHNDLCNIDELANWCAAIEGEKYFIDEEYYLRFYRAQHSELCFGFVMYRTDEDGAEKSLFGYSADSGFDESFYLNISAAPLLILDARPKGNQWHAGFDKVDTLEHPNIHIIGHGIDELEAQSSGMTLPLLQPGQILEIAS